MVQLQVFVGVRRAGVLGHDGATNLFSFEYDPAWVHDAQGFVLSPDLPFEPPPDESAEVASRRVRNFFENLLPEGQALDDAARAHGVSKSNPVGLLAALGRETAGSLHIAGGSAGAQPSDARREIAPEELSQRIRERANQPFSVWDGKVRLSIAGYQDKVAVFIDRGHWFLVEGPTLASTHILKPQPARAALADLPYNEFACMRLAKAVGLPAAEVELVHVPEPVLVVKRFDRRPQGAGIERLHLVDGCQALGLPVGHKYERPYGSTGDAAKVRAGASLAALFRLTATFAAPLPAALALLRWTIFQVLVGNTDAHAKNLSFFCGPEGLSLAPAYDIVCALVYARQFDQTLALAIGDAFDYSELSPYEWANFAHQCELQPRLVARELKAMSTRVLDALEAVLAEARVQGAPHSLLEALRETIGDQCRRHLSFAADVPRAYATLL